MPRNAETVSRLLGLLYESSASPECWPEFLEALRGYAQADMTGFVLIDPANRCSLRVSPGFDLDQQRAYSEHFYKYDMILGGFKAKSALHRGWIGTSQSVVSDAEYHRSHFFNEFAKPLGHVHQIGAMLEELDDGLGGGLTLLRSGGQQPFGRVAASLLTLLAPHMKRAVHTHRTLSQVRNQNAELRHSVEALDLAVVSLDGSGRVVRMSSAAEAILDLRRGIEVESGQLRASVAGEQLRLAELIAGAVATGRGRGESVAVRRATGGAPEAGSDPVWTAAHGGAMMISRLAPNRSLRVVVTPFHSSEVLLGDQPAALVFFSDPDARPASRAAILRGLYCLTPTECRLAGLLVEGLDVATAAEQLKMTVETARFHLKTIFRKTGARRQSDLMRLVLGLPGGLEG